MEEQFIINQTMNILHNNSPGMYAVVYIGNGFCILTKSIFYGNTNKLFYSNGELTVTSSFISHDQASLVDGTVTMQGNISYEITESYQIQFFGTQKCTADNPIPWETPSFTPAVSTPLSTIAQTLLPSTPQSTNNPTVFPSTPIESINDTEKTGDYLVLIIASGVGIFLLVAIAFYYYPMTMKESSSEDIEQRE